MTKHGCNPVFWFWIQSRHNAESKAYFLAVSVNWIINTFVYITFSISWTHWRKNKKIRWFLKYKSDYEEDCQELFLAYVTWRKKHHLYTKYTAVNRLLFIAVYCIKYSKWKLLSCVWLFVTLWTIRSVEFSRPKYWSG